MLAVEAVLALHHAQVRPAAHGQGRVPQGQRQAEIRDRRVFDGGVLHGGVLVADRTGGNHDVAGLHVQPDAAAGAHPEEGIRAHVVQLLHGDGGRRAADARGADADLLPQQGAGIDIEFPVLGNVLRIVEQGSDGFAPARIAGQDHIFPHVPGDTMDMELFFKLLHGAPSLFLSS